MNILILDYLLHFPDITGSSMLETKLANYLNYYEFQVHKYWGGGGGGGGGNFTKDTVTVA